MLYYPIYNIQGVAQLVLCRHTVLPKVSLLGDSKALNSTVSTSKTTQEMAQPPDGISKFAPNSLNVGRNVVGA